MRTLRNGYQGGIEVWSSLAFCPCSSACVRICARFLRPFCTRREPRRHRRHCLRRRVWRGSVAEVGEYGEHASVVVGGWGQVQFGEDAADVRLDGPWGQDEPVGDCLVGAALGDQREHLALPVRQGGQWVALRPAREQLPTTAGSMTGRPAAT